MMRPYDFQSKFLKKKYSFLPSDFEVTKRVITNDPNIGRMPNTGTGVDPATGQPKKNNSPSNSPGSVGINFGSDGFSAYINPGKVVGDIINLFSQNDIKNTQELKNETAIEIEKYNQKKYKHNDLFFNIVKNNQTSSIFAGGDLYNAGAGSKQYDPLTPYEPYKYFMEQSDISNEDIRVILKDELPKAGRESYYPGVDSEIEWAGGNKNIRGSQIILNTSLRTIYEKFKDLSTWGVDYYGYYEYNYNLNDLLVRKMRAMITDFKLKNKS